MISIILLNQWISYFHFFTHHFKFTNVRKKIASFYDEELNSWIEAINYFILEITELEKRLEDIIYRNNIVEIAAKVSVHQLILNKSKVKYLNLKDEFLKQKTILKTNEILIEDSMITKEIEKSMKDYSLQIKQMEKQFADVKYICNEFLSDMLKK